MLGLVCNIRAATSFLGPCISYAKFDDGRRVQLYPVNFIAALNNGRPFWILCSQATTN